MPNQVGSFVTLFTTAPNSMTDAETAKVSPLLAWVRLARLSALPTALSNVLMAFLIANASWEPAIRLLLLLAASSCLYIAGMILNDFYDVEVDSEERPDRPLPSGAISIAAARTAGFGLLAGGIALAAVAGLVNAGEGQAIDLRPPVIAVLLAVAIVLYDGVLKKTILACPLMGACRGLNILLAASTCAAISADDNFFPVRIWWIALAVFVLITGVTWFARNETRQSTLGKMLLPAGVIVGGLVCYSFVPQFGEDSYTERIENLPFLFQLLILAVASPIVRRIFKALATGQPRDVQGTVISVLRSLIILDACICLLVPDGLYYALAVVSLMIPSFLLSRLVRKT